LIVEVTDYAGEWIFVVGENRTSMHASRIDTMVAGGRNSLLERIAPWVVKKSHTTPGFVVVEPVQGVAGGDTGLAAATAVEIHFEGILLTGFWSGEGDERAMCILKGRPPLADPVPHWRRGRRRGSLVPAGKAFDGAEIALLFEQGVD
jgi:hypothetical protein